MGDLAIVVSTVGMYVRNKFQMIPWWLWLVSILANAFFSMLFFVLLADYISNPDATVRYVVIGNVVQSVAATTLYSTADLPGTEKHTGMLTPLMQTPASLFCIFLGMAILNIFAGVLSSVFSLVYAQTVFGIDLAGADVLSVGVVIASTVLALTGFGMMIGSIGIWLRTSTIIANIASYIGLLICGVNFPLSYLPDWINAVASVLPLTYCVKAMRTASEGGALCDMFGDLSITLVLGAVYFVISMFMFRSFERLARRDGAFETF